ncbi:uncharacterized protein RSE6_12179 [Rhynchosporium secalis]|uniref:Uncharacterized protein n=1 Tax=Rhynchosporium secalis TaxID=38038 RepID=A0A1E1MPT6_RHYSE|nr:uncharacterized protein RSE6_12179 [Rhynchosporium secalis]
MAHPNAAEMTELMAVWKKMKDSSPMVLVMKWMAVMVKHLLPLQPVEPPIKRGFHSVFIELFPPQATFDTKVPSMNNDAGLARDPFLAFLIGVERLQEHISLGQTLEQTQLMVMSQASPNGSYLDVLEALSWRPMIQNALGSSTEEDATLQQVVTSSQDSGISDKKAH